MDKAQGVLVRHGVRHLAGIQCAAQDYQAGGESRSLWQGCAHQGDQLARCAHGIWGNARLAHGTSALDASRDYLSRRSPEALQLDTIKGFREVARANEVK